MKKVLLLFLIFIINGALFSKDKDKSEDQSDDKIVQTLSSFLRDVEISGNWFLAFQSTRINEVKRNEFLLKRGYLTLKKNLNDDISIRYTHDITVDKEGDGIGDIKLRFKYIYIKYSLPSLGFFTKPYVEFGIVHRPWINFEQSINNYRVQGSMFLARIGVLSSADFGFTVVSLLGGKIDKDYQKNVSKAYPGKYGSISFGVYNGGGYHALENNNNKIIDGRLTIRPIPELIPGLQFSATGLYGKGNTKAAPDFSFGAGVVTYESEQLVFVGQYYSGKGNQRGSAADFFGNSYSQKGFSAFAEVKIPKTPFSIFGRYDKFEREMEPMNFKTDRLISGITYYFINGSKILVNVDSFDESNSSFKNDLVFEFAVEVKF
ncbi:MAG: hypothetical protein HND52_13115 [Ignavibacteriae bacterium]|nr:hypothetical protein [Ignavibacteriota bacterium]NOG98892.1 hypothetical protein [Ignavibacteriota bacterium]